MILNLQFSDFTSKQRFLILQSKFASNDATGQVSEADLFNDVVKEDFSIIVQISDKSHTDNYKTYSFYNDFLNPKINNLGAETIEKIQQKINNEFRYNEIERNSFLKITINDFLLIHQNIIETDFLLFDIQENLILQTDVVLEFLKGYDFGDSNNIIDKFQSKLQKNDLLLLLHLLRNKGILNHRIDSQFGHLVEKNFQYFEDKTNSYKNITKANKTINEIKNDHRPVEKAIKRLKEILQSDSFFDLNP